MLIKISKYKNLKRIEDREMYESFIIMVIKYDLNKKSFIYITVMNYHKLIVKYVVKMSINQPMTCKWTQQIIEWFWTKEGDR